MKNVRKHRNIKIATTERRRSYLVSEPKTDSFIVYIKTDDIYKDIAKDVQTRFDALN